MTTVGHSLISSSSTSRSWNSRSGPQWETMVNAGMRWYADRFAMYCTVLQCFAVWCSVLQCVALFCSALQCGVSVLQCHGVAVCCPKQSHRMDRPWTQSKVENRQPPSSVVTFVAVYVGGQVVAMCFSSQPLTVEENSIPFPSEPRTMCHCIELCTYTGIRCVFDAKAHLPPIFMSTRILYSCTVTFRTRSQSNKSLQRVCVFVMSIQTGWLRSGGSIKLEVSFAEYGLFYRALL